MKSIIEFNDILEVIGIFDSQLSYLHLIIFSGRNTYCLMRKVFQFAGGSAYWKVFTDRVLRYLVPLQSLILLLLYLYEDPFRNKESMEVGVPGVSSL
jgi:hypothetical protein